MDLLDFSEAEIEEQLSALGYNNIPKQRLQEFKRDLDVLIRQERSKSQSPSEWSSTRSRGDDSRSSSAFTKEKVQLNAPEFNNVFTQPPPERPQRQILTSTFTEGQHSFDMPTRGPMDSYAQYSVMPKYTRPATAPCSRQMPPAELEPQPELEPSQSSNTFSDTSPERDTDTRPRGKPSIKRKVLRMYKNNTRDTDSAEDSDTSGSSFWSDHEDGEEEEDVPRYPAVEDSEEEVIERCVSEQPGGTRQDKPAELLLHTSQTQSRQKGTGSTDRRDEKTVEKHNVLRESPGTGQRKLGQLDKCALTGDHDPTRRGGAEQSGELANTDDDEEESGAERRGEDDDDDDEDEDEAEMSTSDFEDQAESGEDDSKSSDEKDSKSTGEESSKTSGGESSQLSSDGASKSSGEEENSRSSAEGVSKSSNEEGTGGEERSSTENSKSSGEESTKLSGRESMKSSSKVSTKLSDKESRRSSGKESSKSSGREGSKSSREGSVKSSNHVSKSSGEGSVRSLGKESGKSSGEDGSKKSSGRESSKSLSIKSSGKESTKSPSGSSSKSSSEESSNSSGKENKNSSSEDRGKSSDDAEMATGGSEELTETGEDGSQASDDSHSKSSDEDVSESSYSDDAEVKGEERNDTDGSKKSSGRESSKSLSIKSSGKESTKSPSEDTDEHLNKSSDEAEMKADGEEQTENSEDQNKSSDENQSKCSIETVVKRERKRQTESDEDQRTLGEDVKESSEKDQRCISKDEKQKANTQLHITGDMRTVEKKFLPPSDSEEDDNSTGAAFWSDDETGKAENEEGAYAQDVQNHPVEDSEDDEVLERFEGPDVQYEDKAHQFEEQERVAGIDKQTLDRQQRGEPVDTAGKESFGEHGMLEESAGALQDNPNQLEKHAMSGEHDPTQSQAREQSDRPIISEAAFKFVASAEKVKSANEAPTQKHWYDKENIRILMEEAQQSERDMELDYPIAFSPTTSVMTSGYGTYRPDSPRETTTDGDPYQDDFSSLADPEEDGSDVGHFDAQYYADNYRLSVMKDEEFTSNLMLRDDIGSIRNLAGSQTLADHANNSTDVDHKYVGLDTVSEGVGIESNVDDVHQIDKAIDEEESQYSDDEVSELRRPYSRKARTTPPRGADVPACERNDFVSLRENYDHPFNLRRNKWKYYQRRKLKGTAYTRRRTRHKKSAVSGVEECLDRLQMSEMHRRRRGMELESEEMESLSSGGELPSAYRNYFKGMVRSHSENDIRPRPKSVIIPMEHPHTRNLKKTDPVSKYFQYKEEWDAFKAPGEKDHRALRLEIREQLAYQPLPLRPRKALIPNTYVVPTDKRRDALRWEIRHDLAHGIIPSKMAFR